MGDGDSKGVAVKRVKKVKQVNKGGTKSFKRSKVKMVSGVTNLRSGREFEISNLISKKLRFWHLYQKLWRDRY